MAEQGSASSARGATPDGDPDGAFETLGGLVCALGLASRRHRELVYRICRQFQRQLDGSRCQVRQGEGVHVESMDETRHTIPDVSVLCDELEGHPKDPDVLLNPSVLVEVTSERTHQRDHVEKRVAYTAIEALRAYLIVDQAQQVVIVWRREAPGWAPSIHVGDRVEVLSGELVLDIDEAYRALEG